MKPRGDSRPRLSGGATLRYFPWQKESVEPCSTGQPRAAVPTRAGVQILPEQTLRVPEAREGFAVTAEGGAPSGQPARCRRYRLRPRYGFGTGSSTVMRVP